MNKHKFLIGFGVCLIALVAFGQAIKFYNDAAIPQTTVPNSGDVMSLQQTGPNAYRWILMSDLRDYMAGEAGGVVNVTIVNTNYTTNAFITFMTVQSNAFFLTTQFVNVSIVTNLTVLQNTTIEQNLTVKGNATITNVYFLQARPNDIPWLGATNTLNFDSGALQHYATLTPFSVTNVVGATNGYGNSTLLCITNTSGSNVWFYPPTGWKMGTNDMTNCTAGGVFEAWFLEATGRKTIATKLFP